MDLKDIQPVVIYVNDERRTYMEHVSKSLPWETLFYKGYTPETSKDYINYKHSLYPEFDTTLCCTRSHIGALKYFLEHSTKNIVLILEDDITITKNNFFPKLKHVLELWQKHSDEIDYVSIGYGPNQYLKSNKTENELHWDLVSPDGDNDMNVWGALAYLVKRSVAAEIVARFDTPNTFELQNAVIAKIVQNKCKFSGKGVRLQSDTIFSICWRQAFVKPMLIIENPIFNSTIVPVHSNMNNHCWGTLFTNGCLNASDFENAELFLK